MKDFIGVYKNAFSLEMCKFLITHIEDVTVNAGEILKAAPPEKPLFIASAKDIEREDEQFFLSQTLTDKNIELHNFLNETVERYRHEYPALLNLELRSFDNKLQKTRIGGGYHKWHFEQTNQETARRVFAWMIYLNDVEEGGETEFLYYNKRIKPEAGTVVFFPASYTHTHRGNPPISNDKYIATGWFSVV